MIIHCAWQSWKPKRPTRHSQRVYPCPNSTTSHYINICSCSNFFCLWGTVFYFFPSATYCFPAPASDIFWSCCAPFPCFWHPSDCISISGVLFYFSSAPWRSILLSASIAPSSADLSHLWLFIVSDGSPYEVFWPVWRVRAFIGGLADDSFFTDSQFNI